jgi:hypothetical protein
MDQMCGLDDKDLQLKQALDKAVAKLLDPCDGEPADPLLKDWWEKLFPPSASKANQFWSLMRN